MSAFIATLSRIGFLIRKELLALFKEPSARLLLIAPALIQSLLFGYGATFELTNAPYAVLDQSRGQASAELLRCVDGTGVFKLKAMLSTAHDIAPAIEDSNVLLVISIPPDFESQLAAGQAASLQLILDGRNSSTAAAAAAQINAIVADYNQQHGSGAQVKIERRAWFNPNLESRWNIMPALIASLSMLQTMLVAALSVAREREQGTFDQLLVTPLTPMQILIGKAVPSILVGLAQSTIILLIVRWWFQIPIAGEPWLLYLGLLSFTVAAVGIGLSISAVSISMQQAMLYTFLLLMPMMLLSGLLTSVRNMPKVLQIGTYVNPLRFGMDLIRRVYLEGAGLHDIAFDFVPMLVISAITLPLAAWLFRNRLS